MTAFETPFWYKLKAEGVVEWQVNEIMISWLRSEAYVEGRWLKWGIVMHVLHGVALGIIFAFLVNLVGGSGLSDYFLGGLIFSLVLWSIVPFLARNIFQKAMRTKFTTKGLTLSLASHVVYGVVMGGLFYVLVG